MVQSFQANQGTQTNLLVDTTGGAAGTEIPVMKLSIDGAGTFTTGNLWNGNVGVSSGTINVSTISTLPNTPGGTINLATVAGNLGTIGTIGLATVAGNVGVSSGTINVSTISTLPNTPGGTINLATVAGNLGTIGTIGLATVTGNLGTIGTIGLATIAGNVGVSSGTINVSTISTLPNLPQGSINVTAGTFRQDARTTQNILTYGTQVSGTAAFAATIIGSSSVGAGTSIWMNDVSLFNSQSGAGTFILGFGTAQQGTNVLLRAPIGTNGAVGIEKTWPKMTNAGMTNQDLVLSATGAGTVDLTISYLISA